MRANPPCEGVFREKIRPNPQQQMDATESGVSQTKFAGRTEIQLAGRIAAPFTTYMKWLFSLALPLMGAGVIWYAITTMPHQRDILHMLRMAKTVTVQEYRVGPVMGGYDGLLTSKQVSDKERVQLLTAFSLHGWHETPACGFDPHHRIQCVMEDGTTHNIDLCFGCGEYRVDQASNTGLGPWNAPLRETLPRLGVPIRDGSFYNSPAPEKASQIPSPNPAKP